MGASAPIASLAVGNAIGWADLGVSLTAGGLLHAACVGACVGIFGISVLQLLHPKLCRRIGWAGVLQGGALLAIGTAIGQALTDPVGHGADAMDMSVINAVLQGAFSALLAMWLLGFARRTPGARRNVAKSPMPMQIRVGIALFLTAMALTLITSLERLTDGMRSHQGHDPAAIIEIARNQRHLSEKLSQANQGMTTARQDGPSAAEHVRNATEVAHKQSRLLLELLNVESSIRQLFSSELVSAYGRASAAANAMLTAEGKLEWPTPSPEAQNNLQQAGAAHLAAVDDALSVLSREHKLEAQIAFSKETVRGLAIPTACGFLLLVVAAPIVRTTQRQRAIALRVVAQGTQGGGTPDHAA